MIKLSTRISSLLQQLDMAAFGLHFPSTLKGPNPSSKMHQKICKQIFFYLSWENLDTHRPTVLHFETLTSIFIIC